LYILASFSVPSISNTLIVSVALSIMPPMG
jgi:hypothetical protein